MFKLILLPLSLTLVTSGPADRKFRIYGGHYAQLGDIPFQAVYAVDNLITCGATIISPTIAMTAAHCVPKNYRVAGIYAGTNQLLTSTGAVGKTIVRTLIHEDYDDTPGDNHNDIALLFLNESSPFKFNEYIQSAELPSEDEDYQNSTAPVMVSGWGVEDSTGKFSRRLKYANLNLIPRESCIKRGGDIGVNVICAGTDDGSSDSCGGDSGGPLFIGKKVIGIVSFGWPCGRTNRPGAYADVARLRGWIRRHAGV